MSRITIISIYRGCLFVKGYLVQNEQDRDWYAIMNSVLLIVLCKKRPLWRQAGLPPRDRQRLPRRFVRNWGSRQEIGWYSFKSYRHLLLHSGTAFITNDTNGLRPCFATGTNPKFRIDSRLLLSFMDGRFVPFVLLFVLFVISALTANCIPSTIDGRWSLNRSPMDPALNLGNI